MRAGRIFVLALESGDPIKATVENFCKDKGISYATFSVVGGIAEGSTFVAGPAMDGGKINEPIVPIVRPITEPSEFTGTGTVMPSEDGTPVMHLHGSFGRDGRSVSGCFRGEAIVWLTMEIVLTELIGSGPVRKRDERIGVSPLKIEE